MNIFFVFNDKNTYKIRMTLTSHRRRNEIFKNKVEVEGTCVGLQGCRNRKRWKQKLYDAKPIKA